MPSQPNGANTVMQNGRSPAQSDRLTNGRPKPPPAVAWNVLAEDYWDLYTVLLR